MANKRRPQSHRNLERNSWDDIWTAISSDFASHILSRDSNPGNTEVELGTTTALIIPFSTVEVFTTVFQTTFVTVQASSLAGLAPTSSRVRISRSSTQFQTFSSTAIPTSRLASASVRLPSVVVTDGSQLNFPSSTVSLEIPVVMTSGSAAPAPSTESFIGKEPEHKSNKTAVVGGLSGTIAGLLFIGVLVCLLLRRRRRRKSAQAGVDDWASRDETLLSFAREKGFISAVIPARPGTAMTRKSSTQVFQSSPAAAPAVDEDHRIIRMSTCHWPRPFALGAGEGYRESAPAGRLRCTNPDLSRPGTPQTTSSTPKTFFSRQRGLFGGLPRSQQQIQHNQHSLAQEIPTIKVVDPALSRECVARYSNTPSFKSYPSISTVQVVQRTPDDPFLTPPPEETAERDQPRRPSAMRTITASSTWSHIGSLLHPHRNRSATCLEAGVRASSHYSNDTESSARFSRRSDPFDLDRQSRIWNTGSEGRPGSHFTRSQALYEGT